MTEFPTLQFLTTLADFHTQASTEELQALRNSIEILQQQSASWWKTVIGPVLSAVISTLVTVIVFVVLATRKERRDRAIELLDDFMKDEFYVRARLTAQQYLLPNGSKYRKSIDDNGNLKNFVEFTNEMLKSEDKLDREAAVDIRALLSFFWLVDQAHGEGYIKRNEKLFRGHYTWYWVHIIRFRLHGCEDSRIFRKITWMLDESLLKSTASEFENLVNGLPDAAKHSWAIHANAVKKD